MTDKKRGPTALGRTLVENEVGEGSGGRGGHGEDEQREEEDHDLDEEERARTWPRRRRPTKGMNKKKRGGWREGGGVVRELDEMGHAFNGLRLPTRLSAQAPKRPSA